ncbi:hypothetical protein [Acinetobacter variabilis]|uniref:hypothetical protein n=1 Tax=Acinetobacter variabilis TaxID=70346 RepID=UPI0028ACD4D5|nr:hypothetical protein [Acinetobacter variabilis]
MDISAKQEKWRQERPLFEAEFIHSHLLPFFNFNENTGDYEIKSECVNNTDDEDRKVAYEALNTGWVMWLRAKRDAKAQAVPEGFAIKDVINERQRQINQEFYSTENDDEYKQNELLRAAVCYAENVVRRGWVFDSSFGPDVYQEEEVPDLWPWDLDFWRPKNPRRDLVRAAALIIAEIERIDRSTGASQ